MNKIKRSTLNLLNRLPKQFKIAAYTLLYTVLKSTPDEYTINKQNLIVSYVQKHGISCFIETGTCFGNMVYRIKDHVDKVYSIEVDDTLHKISNLRFLFTSNVTILHGDSGNELYRLLPSIKERCLFWLDAHYSGGITGKSSTDTPIIQELKAIDAHFIRNHIILIDDIRCFGEGDYPTIESVCTAIKKINDNYLIEVTDDILRATCVIEDET
jgi:hypothetical protein